MQILEPQRESALGSFGGSLRRGRRLGRSLRAGCGRKKALPRARIHIHPLADGAGEASRTAYRRVDASPEKDPLRSFSSPCAFIHLKQNKN